MPVPVTRNKFVLELINFLSSLLDPVYLLKIGTRLLLIRSRVYLLASLFLYKLEVYAGASVETVLH